MLTRNTVRTSSPVRQQDVPPNVIESAYDPELQEEEEEEEFEEEFEEEDEFEEKSVEEKSAVPAADAVAQAQNIYNLYRPAVCDVILKDLTFDRKQFKQFRMKKTPIRQLLLYFSEELRLSGKRLGVDVDSGNIRPWATNFQSMKLCDESVSQYWNYIDNCMRFCLLMGLNVNHIIQYCEFKFTTRGTPVLYEGSPLKIYAEEYWMELVHG